MTTATARLRPLLRLFLRPPPSPEPGFLEWGFRQQWKELVGNGWTARPGRGLVDWCYIRPGASSAGVVGVDYFTSPEDVQAFLASHVIDFDSGRVGAITDA